MMGETTKGETFTESLSSQEKLDKNGGKEGDSNVEIKFILLKKERRNSGSRGNMKTAFKDLEGDCKMKRNIFFVRQQNGTRIHSHKTAEREFKVRIPGINSYTILPWYKCTDS